MMTLLSRATTRVSTITIVLLAGAIAVFYALSPSNNYAYADDAFPFVVHLAEGEGMNVHHIMLRTISLAVHTVLPSAHGDVNIALVVLRSYVVLTSMLALIMVGLLSYRWFNHRLEVATVSILTVAFGYGYWSYSIVPDIYIPSLAFALLSVWLADTACHKPDTVTQYYWTAGAALSATVTTLNHQAFALVAVPITLGMLLCKYPRRSIGIRVRTTALFVIATLVLVLGIFYGAYLSTGSSKSFVHFLRGYSEWMTMTPYDKLQALTPVYVIIGIIRALIFPEYLLRFDSVYRPVHDRLSLKVLFDERYLLRDMTDIQIIVLTALNCIAVVLLVAGVLVALKRVVGGTIRGVERSCGYWMLLGWIVVQAVLFVWWEPASNEFWIWIWPCISICGVGMIMGNPTSSSVRRLMWFFTIAIIAANAPVMAKYRNGDDCVYQVNKAYLAETSERDVVILADFYPQNYFHRLHPARPRVHLYEFGNFRTVDDTLMADLDRAAVSGGRAIIDPMLAMPEETELAQMRFFVTAGRDTVNVALWELVRACGERNVQLLAVGRVGEPWANYVPYELDSGVVWTDPRLYSSAPASPPVEH